MGCARETIFNKHFSLRRIRKVGLTSKTFIFEKINVLRISEKVLPHFKKMNHRTGIMIKEMVI